MANVFIVFYEEFDSKNEKIGEGVIEVESKTEKISPRAANDLIMSIAKADVVKVKITSTNKLSEEEYKLYKKM